MQLSIEKSRRGTLEILMIDSTSLQDNVTGESNTNSLATGLWEDFLIKELVPFIDARYRTLNNKFGRGLAAHLKIPFHTDLSKNI